MPSSRDALTLDDTLLALADPVRRRVVDLLKARPRRAGEIAEMLAISGPATSKHLRVLRASSLVEEERPVDDARVRVYRLRPERFGELKGWLDDVEKFWSEQLSAFKVAAEAEADQRRRSTNEQQAAPAKLRKRR